MTMSDPLGDMLTRIRNGQQAGLDVVVTPASKLRRNVLNVLQSEGFIRGFADEQDNEGKPVIRVELKYFDGTPVIRKLNRVSKPGRRVYSGVKDLSRVQNGLGLAILSTPQGVMTDHNARSNNVGGEVLCEVF
jgi:small subunit ribosomal protein S8